MRKADRRTKTVETIIGHDTYLEGTLSSKVSLRIHGRVKGTVLCESMVIIGPEGYVEGEIKSYDAFIAGEFKGNVTAKNKVEIAENGKVYGDITTAKIVIDPGVLFEGRCKMLSEKDTTETTDTDGSFSTAVPLDVAYSRGAS
jgi:cytoskeletal protein CcmA (bactofilin family)